MNNKATDLEFIKIVEGYPILYAKEHTRGHKNSSVKNDVWREIAQTLNKSEVACITRWKSIRDRFGKEFRRQQENPQDITNWELFPHLMFLKDHYKHGCARNESIESIKYEPKPKRRKAGRQHDEIDEDSGENGELKICPEELALNQNIIALVKEHDVLYDRKRVRDSKNLTAKNEAWSTIASALDISEEICYMKWKKLRDRFSREYRQMQLNPERPITWIYFNDLRFLESHYRKGIPLPIEEIKRSKRGGGESQVQQITNENPWGDECTKTYYSDTEDHHDLITEEADLQELQEHDFDEMLFIPNKTSIIHPAQQQHSMQVTYHVTQDMATTPSAYGSHTSIAPHPVATVSTSSDIMITSAPADAEDKLHSVISNMETVLRQSHECLKVLKQQKDQHKNDLLQQCNNLTLQPEMLQKINILLDGLHPDQKQRAERKILQFLCECQIKTLNNEEISDVSPVNIY